MAFLSRWIKHPATAGKSTSLSSENRYDDVSLSNKNCREVFSGSSIPVVDLDEKVAALDRRSSKSDCSDVFGGFRNADVAVPYDEQLVNGGAEKTGMRVQADERKEPGYLGSSGKTKMSSKSNLLKVPHHQPNLNNNKDLRCSQFAPKDASRKIAGENSSPFIDDELDENSIAGVSAAALKKTMEQAQKSINIAKMLMERKKKQSLLDGSKSRTDGFSKIVDDHSNGSGFKSDFEENFLGSKLHSAFQSTLSSYGRKNENVGFMDAYHEEKLPEDENSLKPARERPFVEARERAMMEARYKLKKAMSEAKIVTERAAVERATSEAREQALETNMDNNEPEQRLKARLERQQRIMERAAKALEEKNMRDLLVQKEQAERNRLSQYLDADIKRWAIGKEGNLRALLSTLQYILGPDSGWKAISLTEMITGSNVKKAYRKATLYLHPDKLQQRGANVRQKYTCEKVFDLLKAAWNKFNSEEM